MAKFTGMLKVEGDGKLILTIQLTPQNPKVEDIPVADLVEDMLNQRVQIEILPTKPRYTILGDK
jgi:hypothetical protein